MQSLSKQIDFDNLTYYFKCKIGSKNFVSMIH